MRNNSLSIIKLEKQARGIKVSPLCPQSQLEQSSPVSTAIPSHPIHPHNIENCQTKKPSQPAFNAQFIQSYHHAFSHPQHRGFLHNPTVSVPAHHHQSPTQHHWLQAPYSSTQTNCLCYSRHCSSSHPLPSPPAQVSAVGVYYPS